MLKGGVAVVARVVQEWLQGRRGTGMVEGSGKGKREERHFFTPMDQLHDRHGAHA